MKQGVIGLPRRLTGLSLSWNNNRLVDTLISLTCIGLNIIISMLSMVSVQTPHESKEPHKAVFSISAVTTANAAAATTTTAKSFERPSFQRSTPSQHSAAAAAVTSRWGTFGNDRMLIVSLFIHSQTFGTPVAWRNLFWSHLITLES